MGQIPDYSDSRLTSSCLYCGGRIETREHTPSKVLLDKPYPADLAVVGACQPCNEGFSQDEEYVACLIECALSGTTNPSLVTRPNIAAKLHQQPKLRDRIERSRSDVGGLISFTPEHERVENVAKKLAQSHILYELSEVMRDEPSRLVCKPLGSLGAAEKVAFETIDQPPIWPEVGSRMATRMVRGEAGWQVLQPGRYRYATIFGGPTVARLVLSEYLACEVIWTD